MPLAGAKEDEENIMSLGILPGEWEVPITYWVLQLWDLTPGR